MHDGRSFSVRLETPIALFGEGTRYIDSFVTVIDDASLANEAILTLHEEVSSAEVPVIGLDTEWAGKDKHSREVVMLQLAGPLSCVILRAGISCEAVESLLADEAIVKCGVGVHVDTKLLREQFDMACTAALDLNAIERYRPDIGLPRGCVGLRRLAAATLGAEISKDITIRCGDWAAPVLSREQLEYAALDAIASRAVLVAMLNCAGTNDVRGWCGDLMDAPPPRERASKFDGRPLQDASSGVLRCSGYSGLRRFADQKVFDSDGKPMKHMKEKTLRSLIKQGKAIFDEAPDSAGSGVTLRLNFVPIDRYAKMGPEKTDRNTCVGCSAGDVARCYVIPRQFLVHLPLVWKASNCHDIVLLCPRCRTRIEQRQIERAAGLLAVSGGRMLPSGASCTNETALDPNSGKAVAHSRALLKHRRAVAGTGPARFLLPTSKVEEFEVFLRAFRSLVAEPQDPVTDGIDGNNAAVASEEAEPLTEQELQDCATLRAGDPPARRAVEAVLQGGHAALLGWVRGWRELFLEAVQPQYLPEDWSTVFDPGAAAPVA